MFEPVARKNPMEYKYSVLQVQLGFYSWVTISHVDVKINTTNFQDLKSILNIDKNHLKFNMVHRLWDIIQEPHGSTNQNIKYFLYDTTWYDVVQGTRFY